MGPIQKKWIEELRSGQHKQCQRQLTDGIGYCCLGIFVEYVLCLNKDSYYKNSFIVPDAEIEENGTGLIEEDLALDSYKKLGLRDEIGSFNVPSCRNYSLVELNDTAKLTFEEIADFIEANEEAVFVDDV